MAEERGVVKYEARDGQDISLTFDTVRRYLVQGRSELVTPQEMMFFMGVCKSKGLNPFIKDAYLIKYSEREGAAIITSIDYFRKQAKAQRDCKGWSKGIIVERNGKIEYTNGLMLEGDKLLGGWFQAQPAEWSEPFRLEVNLGGYIKRTKEGNITKFWAPENQPTQIMKVAESQGLRTLWPGEFQQVYTSEEIGPGNMFEQTEMITRDVEKQERHPDNSIQDQIHRSENGNYQDAHQNAEKVFWAQIDLKKIDRAKVQEFFEKAYAHKPELTPAMVMKLAVDTPENFKAFLRAMDIFHMKNEPGPSEGDSDGKGEEGEWNEDKHISKIKAVKTIGLKEYEEFFRNELCKRGIGPQAMAEFLSKWKRLMGASYFDADQPGGNYLAQTGQTPSVTPGTHKTTNGAANQKWDADLETRRQFLRDLDDIKNKVGEERFMNKLGDLGYERTTAIPKSEEAAIKKSMEEEFADDVTPNEGDGKNDVS